MAEYITIKDGAEDEFIERKSRFIGYSKHVESEEEAMAFVAEIRARHWDARHNVYAYVLRDGQTRRYSDDGEPQGSAGVPVLDVILKEGIVDVCVVVTRYFGGILLGVGGLVRAYSQGARIALAAAEKMHMAPCHLLELSFDYNLYGKISYILPNYGIKQLDADFSDIVKLTLLIRESRMEAFQKELTELTAGTVSPILLESRYDNLP